MLAKKIKHIQQPSLLSCMATCMAMVTGLDINEVLKYVRVPCHVEELAVFLTHHQIWCKELEAGEDYSHGLFIVIVSSLNHPGGAHAVVVDYRDMKYPKLYDPNKGKKGKKIVTLKKLMSGEITEITSIRLTDCSTIHLRPGKKK